MIKQIRKATLAELSTPVEIIPYSRVERAARRIEKEKLKSKGTSTAAVSMVLPHGMIVESRSNDLVVIHKAWRQSMKDAYENETRPIMV